MPIENNKVVSIHYRLTEAGGALLEQSPDNTPLVYLHGQPGVLPSLQEALTGKDVGDQLSLTLTPEQGYGTRHEGGNQRVSINHILREGKAKPKLHPGMLVYLNTKDGAYPATVLKVGLKTVDVDLNHPYAGKSLHFDIDVVALRDATAEEIDHGHVHGEGGVQH